MQELKSDIGVRLMQRSTRRLTLTDAGQTFFARCPEQIEALSQSAQDLSEGSEVPQGDVRVAAAADFLIWFPVSFLSESLAAYPKVQLEFGLSGMRVDPLGEGIDIAFWAGKAIEPDLIARQMGWSQSAFVASPRPTFAHAAHPTRRRAIGASLHHLVDRSGRICDMATGGGRGIVVAGRFHASNLQVQLNDALENLGIALVPTTMAAPQVESGRLQKVLPECGRCVGVYAVY